jgi:RNA polymerase sigma factor (sigma-70 family)
MSGGIVSNEIATAARVSLMGQAEVPPSHLFGEDETDFWPYRRRTAGLLRRYARASVEMGRLPSLLGREFFRSRVTSYTLRSFEDVVIFVTDMEQAIERLDALEKRLLAMNVVEEHTIPEVARLTGCTQRTVERVVQRALDQLSQILLAGGLMEPMPEATDERSCQEARNYKSGVSHSNKARNKCARDGGAPRSNLIS